MTLFTPRIAALALCPLLVAGIATIDRVPALAAPVSRLTAAHDIATPTLETTSTGTVGAITVRGLDGASATVTDPTGKVVAGTTLTRGTGTMRLTIPATVSTFTVVLAAGGETSAPAEAVFNAGVEADTDAPSIDSVSPAGVERAIVSASGRPGSTMSVRDDSGTLLGAKRVGTSGSVQIPVATDPDAVNALTAAQTSPGTPAAETSTAYVAPPTAELTAVSGAGPETVSARVYVAPPRGATSVRVVDGFGSLSVRTVPKEGGAFSISAPRGTPSTISIFNVKTIDGVAIESARVTVENSGEVRAPAQPVVSVEPRNPSVAVVRIIAPAGLDFVVEDPETSFVKKGSTAAYDFNDGPRTGSQVVLPNSQFTGTRVTITLKSGDQSSVPVTLDIPRA